MNRLGLLNKYNALYDMFNYGDSNVSHLDKKAWKEEVDNFRQSVDHIKSSLDIVTMLMVWLYLYPHDDDIVREFISQHNLKGQLYGGLVRLLTSKKFRIRPCISGNLHKVLNYRIDRQYAESYCLEYRYKFLWIIVDILYDFDTEKYLELLERDNTYWLAFHHIIKYENKHIDRLLCSNDFVTASIGFYSLTKHLSYLINQYNDVIRLQHQDLSQNGLKEEIERLYKSICTRLRTKNVPHMCELCLYHMLTVNRACHVTNQLILDDNVIRIIFNKESSDFTEIYLNGAIRDVKDLLILFMAIQIAELAPDELAAYYRWVILILVDLVEKGNILFHTNDGNRFGRYDSEYIGLIIRMLPRDVKMELKMRLIEYSNSLYVSPLDRLVRYKLYMRYISRYETAQYIMNLI